MASPSRSGSVASSTFDADCASFFSSLIVSALPLILMYSGSKLFSMSTPSLLLGRSLMCPTEAITLYFDPRYLLMIFALDGDSTTRRVFAGVFLAAVLPLVDFFAAVVFLVLVELVLLAAGIMFFPFIYVSIPLPYVDPHA